MKEKEIEEVKKIELSDIEATLKEQFDLLMSHPEQFDISTKTQEKIKDLTDYTKKAGYKLLVKNAKAAIAKQNNEEMAKTLKQDLEEDKVFIKDKAQLEKVFKNPEKEKWKLEPEMIKHIQSMSEQGKIDLMEEYAEENNIDMRSVGRKILDGFKKLWTKLEPVFETILKTVGVWASESVGKIIEDKMGNHDLKKVITEGTKTVIKTTIDQIGETLEETTKVHSSKTTDIEEDTKEGSVLEVKEEVTTEESSLVTTNEVKEEVKIEETISVTTNETTEEVKIEETGNVIHENTDN